MKSKGLQPLCASHQEEMVVTNLHIIHSIITHGFLFEHPDLTLMDFSIRCILKNTVFSLKIQDVEHLQEQIQFEKLHSLKIFNKAYSSMLKRFELCLEKCGIHFEHIL